MTARSTPGTDLSGAQRQSPADALAFMTGRRKPNSCLIRVSCASSIPMSLVFPDAPHPFGGGEGLRVAGFFRWLILKAWPRR